MKTFIIKAIDWSDRVDVDESIFNKDSEQAVEAMTLSLDRYLEGKIKPIGEKNGIGVVITAFEPKDENNEYLHHYALSEFILRNAGRHKLADKMKICLSSNNKGGEHDS